MLGGILVANVALLVTTVALTGLPGAGSWRTIVVTWSFFPFTLLAILARDRRVA